MQPLRLSFRRLNRQPAFSLTAVLTLALCIGANLIIFSVIHSVLLKPLPFAEPERLVTVVNQYPGAGIERSAASVRDYFTRRDSVDAFASLSAFRHGTTSLGEPGKVSRRPTLQITPEFFATLGVELARGRAFTEQTMDVGGPKEVIVSHRLWQQQFDGDPAVLGQTLRVAEREHRIVGVLPEDFRFLSSPADVYLPLVSTDEQRALNALHGERAEALGRLRAGVGFEQAQAQLEAHYAIHSKGYPWAREVEAAGFSMRVAGLQAEHVAAMAPVLLLLQGAALGLLLIGMANLLNLFLVRCHTLARELGLRRALGAGSLDLLRQVGGEVMLLAVLACAIALPAAWQGLQLIGLFGADALPLGAQVEMPPAAVLIAACIPPVLAVCFGIVVALLAGRSGSDIVAGAASRSVTVDHRGQRLRRAFAVVQIACAFVLLSGASLLVMQLRAMLEVDPGFNHAQLVTASLSLPAARYPDADALQAFADRLVQRAAIEPDAGALGISTNLPVRGDLADNHTQAVHVIGYAQQGAASPLVHFRYGVAGDYFAAMQIPLRTGRTLDNDDAGGAARVVVVDEAFARLYWPDGNALGQRLFVNGPDARDPAEAFTVVGVVGTVKQVDLGERSARGTLYLPHAHLPNREVHLAMRSNGPAGPHIDTLRRIIADVDPELAANQIRTMEDQIEGTLAARRTPAMLASAFSIAALLLAGLGVFGLMSYTVALQRRDIGLRVALGAQPRQILGRYLGSALRLLLAGSVVGLVASGLLVRVMATWLAQAGGTPGIALLLSAAMIGAITLVAATIPAARAARIDPVRALADD